MGTARVNQSMRLARPGYYILFSVTIDGNTFSDAYYADTRSMTSGYWSMLVRQLGVEEDSYSIAWCPSRNQAQKSAVKNWSK